ncbi:hypothetical protein FGX01_01955, partial [Xylella fastidiosa subsp. multiplex]|nr:hypothetical protein [Xylella fastidiosa subsp. multiplex]
MALLPDSITSVSAAGLAMPYGGTTDGIGYQYDGRTVALKGAGSGAGIRLGAELVDVQAGALLDLSGGGE